MKNQKNETCEVALQGLREEIDNIDTQLIDLLEKRMGVVSAVGDLKRDHAEKFFIRSNREADMIKDLVKKSKLFPKSAIISIWRKIIVAANMHEQPLKIAISAVQDVDVCKGLVNEYYNSSVPKVVCKNAVEVISSLKKGESQIGVFALFGKNLKENWWVDLAENDGDLKVFAKIPLYDIPNNEAEFVAVADKKAEKSEDDNSLIYVNAVEGDNLVADFEKSGFAAKILQSSDENYLMEVEGFHLDVKIDNSSRIKKLKIIGHYALPIKI